MKTKFYITMFVLLTLSILVSACAPVAEQGQPASAADPAAAPISQANNSPASASSVNHADSVDTTHLPLGDGKISTSPKVGYVFSCQTQFNGGGASHSGNWINGDGTFDLSKKPTVDGSVTWPSSFTITLNGDQRVITSNDLPNHATGIFPISPKDDAYNFDRNPNSIRAQNIQFSLPANPQLAATPTCVGMGMIGIMTSGTALFNALDAGGRDAVAHEVQDACGGHPQQDGEYHYHNLSNCIKDDGTGQSQLVGYALDGFGIYGPRDANGKILTNADLDECHGTTSEVDWNGQKVMMYHYVATSEYPYTIGCFRGTPVTVSGQQQGQPGLQNGPQNGQQHGGPLQGGQGQQPPQQAITACANLSQNAACSFTGMSGQQISGTCQTPPQSTQLTCVPAGGPPHNP